MFFLDILISNIFNFWNAFIEKWSLKRSRNENQLLKGNVLNPRYKNFADTITYRTWLNCPQTRRTKLFYVCLFPSLCNFGSETSLIWSVSYKAEPTLIGKTRVTLLTRLDHWRFPAHAFWTVYWVYIKYLLNLSIISITINSNHNIVVFVKWKIRDDAESTIYTCNKARKGNNPILRWVSNINS